MKTLVTEIQKRVKNLSNGPAMESMRKLGINYETMHGLSLHEIKAIASDYLNNHELALELWRWDDRELKIMATMIADPNKMTPIELNAWAGDLKNSELAEQLAINLAFRTSKIELIISSWISFDNEFAKKSALVLLAWSAQRSTQMSETFFIQQLPFLINLVNEDLQLAKGISFAFRAIGKRNLTLNSAAIESLKKLKENSSYNAQFIVEEALWELELDIIQERLK